METKVLELAKAGERWLEVLDEVRQGNEVLLIENSRVIARVIPAKSSLPKRQPGLHSGLMRLEPSFDEPLPDSFWEGKG